MLRGLNGKQCGPRSDCSKKHSVLGPHFLLVYLNLPVMLGSYLQQTPSADNIFRCIFLGALRVKKMGILFSFCSLESILPSACR